MNRRSLVGLSLIGFSLFVAAQNDNKLPKPDPAFNGTIDTRDNSKVDWPQRPKAHAGAPNVVLILLDDGGFGATSVFGGPIDTPALQQLADQGLRYNRFHVNALCSPTRAALLSGRNSHQMGFGNIMVPPDTYPIQRAERELQLLTLEPPWPPTTGTRRRTCERATRRAGSRPRPHEGCPKVTHIRPSDRNAGGVVLCLEKSGRQCRGLYVT